MGSPLAPVLANIFMGFHEDKWLNEYNLNKPKFNQNQLKDKSHVHFLKFSYIGNLSHHIKRRLSKLCKEFCILTLS